MKIDTDYYNHFPNTKVEKTCRTVWVTDDTGVVWEFCAKEGGMRVRSTSTPRDAISIRSEASNTVTLHARTVEDIPS